MHDQYDLVKVSDFEDKRFIDALGIVEEVDQDIDGDICYKLLFVGRYHNELSRNHGIHLFYDDELEGI